MGASSLTMDSYSAWIGRRERRVDRIDEALVARWLATFDRTAPGDGSAPQGIHWCLCKPDAPTALLGADGHPRRENRPDGFLPPVPLPRRMWAGSRMAFHAPLRPGAAIERHSRVVSIDRKSGRNGDLVFVEVAHETFAADELAVHEVQSIVYREGAPAGAPAQPPELGPGRFDGADWPVRRALVPSEPLLFRYSALTFNGHRIHYDLNYATTQEGYRGLVVHGPLTATLLLDLARRELGDNALGSFAFRGLSPAICGETLHLALRRDDSGAIELAAFAADGRQVMSAEAALRDLTVPA
jgi:3-methylfumaryl-CoA hydratase